MILLTCHIYTQECVAASTCSPDETSLLQVTRSLERGSHRSHPDDKVIPPKKTYLLVAKGEEPTELVQPINDMVNAIAGIFGTSKKDEDTQEVSNSVTKQVRKSETTRVKEVDKMIEHVDSMIDKIDEVRAAAKNETRTSNLTEAKNIENTRTMDVGNMMGSVESKTNEGVKSQMKEGVKSSTKEADKTE